MSAPTITPEVQDFLAVVRGQLADLPSDERDDLIGGLEADLGDLVAEHGPDALGDPLDYARELRSAAGLEPMMGRPRGRRTTGETVTSALDAASARWDRAVSGLPGSPWEFIVSLRPTWWVLRAWLALQVADLMWGSGAYNTGLSVIPSLLGWGLPLLVVTVLVSIQIGRGRLWPAQPRGKVFGRVVLVGLNTLAVLTVPAVMANFHSAADAERWHGAPVAGSSDVAPHGISFKGQPVRNIYPYDAHGNLLAGVQLIDDRGRKLTVTRDPYAEGSGWGEMSLVPWADAETSQVNFNVFPMAEQRIDLSSGREVGDPGLQQPPFVALPPVTLPGIDVRAWLKLGAPDSEPDSKPDSKQDRDKKAAE